jgi:hypothetical protein
LTPRDSYIPNKRVYAFDERCAGLAAYFLNADNSHTPEREADLAQDIQDVIEEFLRY